MERKYFVSSAIITLILSVTMAAAFDSKVKAANEAKLSYGKPEEIKPLVPATMEDAEAKMLPVKNRFILWTRDGIHVMWGNYGNGFFTATDNVGAKVWGIYGRSVFAGFYNGEFFYGKYSNGNWHAVGLFGENLTRGKYVTFPAAIPVAISEAA